MKDQWLKLYFVTALLALAFAYGVAVGLFKIFPYKILEGAAAAAKDWAQYPRHHARVLPEKFLSPARHEGSAVVLHVPDKIQPGLTFLTGFFGDALGMRLVEMDGEIVHEWHVSYDAIWPEAPHMRSKPHDWDVEIHGAYLFPDGDVVFNFQYGGLVRIDRCSDVKWKIAEQTHHSVTTDKDGQFWVPSRKLRNKPDNRFPGLPAPFQEEFLLEVSPDGKILRKISILEAIYNSGFEGVLFASGAHNSELIKPLDHDFTHLNDIEVLPETMAAAFPNLEAGDLLVSLRNLNLVLVLGREDASVKWSQTGPFLRQHDPDFRADGTISVFDNRRDSVNGTVFGGSRIVSIDPQSSEVNVIYGGTDDTWFYSETMGDHQNLPNGNILITESRAGYGFEITTQGELVWAYVNRWNENSVAPISRATRYPESHFVRREECR